MPAMHVKYYNFQKCKRQVLPIRKSIKLATNVSKYNFQKCWRYMLAILIFRNAGDTHWVYNSPNGVRPSP